MMKTQPNHIIFIIAVALFTLIGADISAFNRSAHAGESTVVNDTQTLMEESATVLFAMINAARQNPLETAESLGMDRNQLLEDLPELKDILTKGLPVLIFNEQLNQTARNHTREMLDNSYYAYESLDGRTIDQRLLDMGYMPLGSGESLGLIFFKNFISPDRAVSQIFEKMFKDELSPGWKGPRNILNPDFKDLGVGIGGGLYQFDGMKGNVYLATCDFGYSAEIYEFQLVQLVNQFRAQPAAVAASLDVDVEEILGAFPELRPVFLNGLPPVRFNGPLYLSADVKINDMLENGYFGYASPGGITLGERIWNTGYRAEWAAETLARTLTCDNPVPPELMVSRIFRQLFFNSLRMNGYRDTNLLNEKAEDAGFRIVAAESTALSGICGNHLQLTVGDFGAGLIKSDPAISGVVFVDENNNNLYDIGEEVPDIEVTIRARGVDGVSRTVKTSAAGGYEVFVKPGLYRVSVGDGERLQFKWVQPETVNVWQVFKIQPETVNGQ